MLFESLRMSWENIVNNKLRSFLTMLGIVIGVASIIALISIVDGATNSISDQVTSLGVNKVMISATGTPLKQGLNDNDINTLNQVPNVSGVSPTVSAKTKVSSGKSYIENATVQGKNEVYFKNDTGALKSGRTINNIDIESKNNVALIGTEIADDLFYGIDPIGHTVNIKGVDFKIIGLLKSAGGFSLNSNDNAVIIPYTSALRLLEQKNIYSIDVFLDDTNLANESVKDIENVLKAAFNYKDNAFTLFNMGDMIDSFETMMGMMSMLLAGIAAISLVVGGIGIMNMMLVSITERTVEIGLRKALGATPNKIQIQFIIEAILLSLIGGALGFVLGTGIAYLACMLIDLPFAITTFTITLSIGFSGAVGIIFGYMPARRASRLNPIEALRSL